MRIVQTGVVAVLVCLVAAPALALGGGGPAAMAHNGDRYAQNEIRVTSRDVRCPKSAGPAGPRQACRGR